VTPPDSRLIPDRDEFNVAHIARHGVTPEQVEEVYYGEGPLPTLGVRITRRTPSGMREERYRLWGTDAAGTFLEVIVAVYPRFEAWRCVTAYRMSEAARQAYLRRIRR
jgi:hypothetical protein